MKEALERIIKTLIDSGGDQCEYDSNDIQILVNWIENQQKQFKNINYECPLAILSEEEIKDWYIRNYILAKIPILYTW